MQHFLRSVSLLAISALSACGGGGGNSVSSAGTKAPQIPAPLPAPSASPAPTPTPTAAPTPAPTPTPAPSPAQDAGSYPAPVTPPPGTLTTPSALQPVRSANDTAEYRQNYLGNELVGALYALDNGWTGQGVVVGVIDDGVNKSLSTFDNRLSSLSKDFGSETTAGVTTKRDSISDSQADHGTAVAALIAGNRDGTGTMGIAPDAKLAILRTSDYNTDTKTEALVHDAAAVDYATANGIKILNRSLTSQGFNVDLRNAVARFGKSGGILINAAGNQGAAAPADSVNVDATQQDAWIFVVALDSSNQTAYSLAGYSNKAGNMAERTVAASGTNVTTRIDGSASAFSGTSSATAQVSGLAALILSKWPQLSGTDAGKIILSTARDIGEPGVDAVFGHGLIDVTAALLPVDPVLSNGSSQASLATSFMTVPEAIGIESIQTALSDVTVLDKFGRDFSGSAAGLIARQRSGSETALRRRLMQLATGGSSGFTTDTMQGNVSYTVTKFGFNEGETHSALTSAELVYRFGHTNIGVSFNSSDTIQTDIMGLAPFADGIRAYAPQAATRIKVDRETALGTVGIALTGGRIGSTSATAATVSIDRGPNSLRASLIRESGSIMGSISTGALSLGGGATTALAEVHRNFALAGGWSLEGYASIGVTNIRTDPQSIVTGSKSLVGTRAGLQAHYEALGGQLSFGLAQPLTIESGSATLTLASHYDPMSQSLVYRSSKASLASTQRPVQLTFGYSTITASRHFRFGFMQDMSDGRVSALLGYGFRF